MVKKENKKYKRVRKSDKYKKQYPTKKIRKLKQEIKKEERPGIKSLLKLKLKNIVEEAQLQEQLASKQRKERMRKMLR